MDARISSPIPDSPLQEPSVADVVDVGLQAREFGPECEDKGLQEKDRLSAVLDMYQQALEDLRLFAISKSLNKHFDGEQEMYTRLEAKIASPDFLNRLEPFSETPRQTEDDQSSWAVINAADLACTSVEDSRNSLEQENYIMVNQQDIVDGMACFMAKYISSLPQAKEMSPRQLQAALRKAFGNPKKSKFQRFWSRSKFFYTAASWGATAVSLYNNPAVVQAASNAFWISVELVSKYVAFIEYENAQSNSCTCGYYTVKEWVGLGA